ncbi:conserved hypothetical protein [Desulfamplus magnetovallimortis]|uniref:Uncharacterized protein n=1 Tax=Desulfamplus magnetovallimortis TaxID=1246637 RepID=A0A1W1HDR0_9BACT|nr:hypothetical protein [Desulfamplus magnetovallimortis]SLM30610.1 conserved hypothetical protein [Desulfamplus magnetovallimortis]
MNLTLAIDFNQLKSLISQCGINEKKEIVQMLEKDTFPIRLNRFLEKIKTDDLNLDDITAEVEAVRGRRYGAKGQ